MLDDQFQELPAAGSPIWGQLVAIILVRLINGAFWAFVGGLGWGCGIAAGAMLPWAHADIIGGAVGLACALFGMLTIGLGPRSEYTPIQLAAFGGAAVGSASLALLDPFSREWNYLIGGGAGFFVGMICSVMRQSFAPVEVLSAKAAAGLGAVIFAGAGLLLGDPMGAWGWGIAGSLALFAVALFAECMRREPAILIDADEKPIHVYSRGETLRLAVRRSWSPAEPLAWGWNGLLAGLFGGLWAEWAANHPRFDAARPALQVCGGLAVLVIILGRLGIGAPKGADARDADSQEHVMGPSWEQAAIQGDVDLARRLLAAGEDVNSLDRHGQTALMLAAHHGHRDLAQLLIENGANLDHTAKYRLSALMLAVVAGHTEIARMLARSGADLTLHGSGAPGFADKTAYDLAVARGMTDVYNELKPVS